MAGSRLFHLSRLKALLAALFFYTLYVIGSTYSKLANSINLTLSDVVSDLPFLESRTLVEEEEPILDLEEPLNVIIFYPDDWRHDDLGDTNPSLNTPFFSRMARQGIRFTHNAVTTSICWISRGTLFTGQWVSRHASTYLFRPLFAREPERWKETWPSILQKFGGYWVGHVGKWQYQKAGYRNLFNYSDYFEGVMWYGKDHAAKRARNSAIKFLMDRPKDRPFAMTVAIYPPKGSSNPESAVPEYLAKYQNVTIPEPYDREAALKLLPTFLQDNKTDARIRYNYRFVDVNDYQTTMKT
jgi:arylsulfatase